MATYTITVDANVQRTVTVEADTINQAVEEANIEVIAILGAYRCEAIEIKKEEDNKW
jgi:hypothetical protein